MPDRRQLGADPNTQNHWDGGINEICTAFSVAWSCDPVTPLWEDFRHGPPAEEFDD